MTYLGFIKALILFVFLSYQRPIYKGILFLLIWPTPEKPKSFNLALTKYSKGLTLCKAYYTLILVAANNWFLA